MRKVTFLDKNEREWFPNTNILVFFLGDFSYSGFLDCLIIFAVVTVLFLKTKINKLFVSICCR